VTRREVVYDDKVALAMSRFLDDPEGLAQVMDAVDDLADDPRPAGAIPLRADRLPPAHRPADPEGGTQ
jgi:mRNA interferase RelE/StbE